MARTKKKDIEEVVVDGKKVIGVTSGSHLKVTHFEDGTTNLEWDDAALLRDVQEAIKAHEATELVGSVALGKKPTTRSRKAK